MTLPRLAAVRGAGDLATGVAFRLAVAGIALVMSELPAPTVLRRRVAFAEAVYEGWTDVEGVVARRCEDEAEVRRALAAGEVAVIVDPTGSRLVALRPELWVDAVMAKRNTGTRIDLAPLVVALGPGFEAGVDCHAVVETQRGHRLGRVLWRGHAAPATHRPEPVLGRVDRVLRAPGDGRLLARRAIGDRLSEGEVVAEVAGRAVTSPFAGVLRGLARSGLTVQRGQKVGDVDPRGVVEHALTISDKALAVGGGVLEALLAGRAVAGRARGPAAT